MEICFTIAGHRHCFFIPILEWPHFPPHPDPGPYRDLLQDAILVNSIQGAVKNISDIAVRNALQHGVGAAIGALQKRAGEGVTINAG